MLLRFLTVPWRGDTLTSGCVGWGRGVQLAAGVFCTWPVCVAKSWDTREMTHDQKCLRLSNDNASARLAVSVVMVLMVPGREV